jgi:UDP-N-acetylglucosamine 1-carboxyvinyltransferase
MNVRYVVHGGSGLRGTVSVKGSPLATVGAMAAALLTREKVTLTNVPHLFDLDALIDELRQFGVAADWTHPHEMTVYAERVLESIQLNEAHLVGWSPALLGALLVRCQKIEMAVDEIDLLDERLSGSVKLIRKFGGEVDWVAGKLRMSLHHLHGAEVSLDGMMAEHTLLAVLLAATAAGETILHEAVVDPETEDVFTCLSTMGARVDRLASSQLRVVGQLQLQGATHQVVTDRYEAAVLAVMAIITGGDILVDNIRPSVLMSFLAKLQQLGASYQVSRDGIRFWSDRTEPFRPINLSVKPYPGIGRDWLPLFLPLMCQVDGECVVETDSVEELSSALRVLQGVGGEVHLHYGTARVFGPSKLVASKVEVDGYAAALTALLAAIGSKGTSELGGMEVVDGRFDALPDRLGKLGVKIERSEA